MLNTRHIRPDSSEYDPSDNDDLSEADEAEEDDDAGEADEADEANESEPEVTESDEGADSSGLRPPPKHKHKLKSQYSKVDVHCVFDILKSEEFLEWLMPHVFAKIFEYLPDTYPF